MKVFEMGILQGIQSSYSMFGPKGVLLVAKARLSQRPVEIAVSVGGSSTLSSSG